MNKQFRYYMHEGPDAFSFELAGNVSDHAARQLEQAWRTASSVNSDRSLIVDLSYVTQMGEAGRAMLGRWFAKGAQLVARLPQARSIVEAITGQGSELIPAAAQRHTWVPFRLAAIWAVGLAAFFAPAPSHAADLKPETLQTWAEYVKVVAARAQKHLVPGNSFLSIDESPGRDVKLRAGEVLVFPASAEVPKKVPSGLIHDWVGAAFIPGVRASEVLRVLRDYAGYKDVYHPNVVDSRPIASSESEDRFSLLIMNKSAFSGGALDSDYHASYMRLDDRRWCSVSEATRIQEVAGYGTASQHTLPENKGTGVIWRLYSITRFEERDGGVYVEVEAMALSRDIPSSLRWVIDPIVRRISRSALLTSLQQTEDAVRSKASGIRRSPALQPCPTGVCAATTAGSQTGPMRSFR
ncbi:MAG TPA: hypothetical protein VGN17_01230 [Bryobacteraceae bacterium]|jgi:hypothetical protein